MRGEVRTSGEESGGGANMILALNLWFGFAPGAHVYPVQHQTKKIGGNKSPLRRLEPNDADHDAVHCGKRPTFPTPPADQNRRSDG